MVEVIDCRISAPGPCLDISLHTAIKYVARGVATEMHIRNFRTGFKKGFPKNPRSYTCDLDAIGFYLLRQFSRKRPQSESSVCARCCLGLVLAILPMRASFKSCRGEVATQPSKKGVRRIYRTQQARSCQGISLPLHSTRTAQSYQILRCQSIVIVAQKLPTEVCPVNSVRAALTRYFVASRLCDVLTRGKGV